MEIVTINDEHIKKWLIKEYLPTVPKKDMLKRLIQLLNQIFRYALKKKYCLTNPLAYIDVKDYYKYCDCSTKSDEERSFGEEQLSLIIDDIFSSPKNIANPCALAQVIAANTALRVGELLAIKKEDILGDYLHIHRQYVRDFDENNHAIHIERDYTKNERLNPRDGRLIPITEECRKAINYALALPGESDFLLHDKNGKTIKPRAYLQNLKRRCNRLGISVTNNHAFRIAYNSYLTRLGIAASDRALILGHSVETNERFYSVSDKRRIDVISEIIKNGEAK